MDDILFPSWVKESPVFSMVMALGKSIREKEPSSDSILGLVEPQNNVFDYLVAPYANLSRKLDSVTGAETLASFADRGNQKSSDRRNGSGEVHFDPSINLNASVSFTYPHKGQDPLDPAESLSGDLLHDPRVQILLRQSGINDIAPLLLESEVEDPKGHSNTMGATISGKGKLPCISKKNAVALVSLLAFAVDCCSLPSDRTKGFYTECSSLYITLMRRIQNVHFMQGVDVQGLVASLIACGLKIRDEESYSKKYSSQGKKIIPKGSPGVMGVDMDKSFPTTPRNGGGNSSDPYPLDLHNSIGKTNNRESGLQGTKANRNIGLSGFDGRIIDSIIVSCIPSDLSECAGNSIALGALEGLALTRSKKPVGFSTSLVTHLHNLMDAFATSTQRKELSYKQLLSLLLGSLCCSKVIDYERMNSWIVAIIQQGYLIRGLFQKELLHAHVVSSTLILLVRQYQKMTDEFAIKKSNDKTRVVLPNFKEGDELIGNVWNSLHTALTGWDEPHKRQVTLYGSNVQTVIESLLHAEVERLRCYCRLTVGSVTQVEQKKDQSKRKTDDFQPYTPSAEEEDLRIRTIENITKFLLLPTSVMGALVRAENSSVSLRCHITELCTHVLTIFSATEFQYTSGFNSFSNSGSDRMLQVTCFSSHYERSLESIAKVLIRYVLQGNDFRNDQTTEFSQILTRGERAGSSVAAHCLESLCSGDHRLRTFAVADVIDTVISITSRYNYEKSGETLPASADDPTQVSPLVPMNIYHMAERLGICFRMLSTIVISKRYSVVKAYSTENMTRFVQLLCDLLEDSLRLVIVSNGGNVNGNNNNNNSNNNTARRRSTIRPNTGHTTFHMMMEKASKAIWLVVLRVHGRIRTITRDGIQASFGSNRNEKALYIKAINEESKSIKLLLRIVLQCALNMVWPGSGIIYQTSNGIAKSTPAEVAPIAILALSPLLKSLCLLFHLATLFPVSDLRSLATHNKNAPFLVMDELGDQYIHHYYFQPSNLGSVVYAEEGGMSLFRSFWLMLTLYGFTSEALSLASSALPPHPEITSRNLSKKYYSGRKNLTEKEARLIRLLAASAAPLLRMRSLDYQEAIADISVLIRYGFPGTDTTSTFGEHHRSLRQALECICDEVSSLLLGKLTLSELFLMRSLMDLEMLRASSGSISTLTLYQHFEVREFIANPGIRHILKHMSSTLCKQYLAALSAMLPDIAYKLASKDSRQLVLLYAFSLASVRESAKTILNMIIDTLPSFVAYFSALPLFWTVINLLEVGTDSEIVMFCELMGFAGSPATAPDPDSLERKRQVQGAVEMATYWAEKARLVAPLALFELATQFVLGEESAAGVWGGGRLAGSQLAVKASQYEGSIITGEEATRGAMAVAERRINANAHTLMKRSSAKGQISAYLKLIPLKLMESILLAQLKNFIRANLSGGTALTSEEHVQAVLRNYGTSIGSPGSPGSVDRKNLKPGTFPSSVEGACGSRNDPRTVRSLREFDSFLNSAVAFLCGGHGSSSGQEELLRYIVQGPIQLFNSHYISIAVHGWRWLIFTQNERYLLPVLLHLSEGLRWTISQRLGLFDSKRPSQSDEVQCGEASSPSNSSPSSSSSSTSSSLTGDISHKTPHSLIFSFLAECYVNSKSPVAFHTTVLRALFRLSNCLTESPTRFSTKDSSFSELMRCALVVGTICQNIHLVNERRQQKRMPVVVPHTSIGALRQKCYLSLLQWFRKIPPSWYFAQDGEAAKEEAVVLEQLMNLLCMERKSILACPLGFLDFNMEVPETRQCCDIESLGSVSHARIRLVRQAVDHSEAQQILERTCSSEQARLASLLGLLIVLVKHERTRLQCWIDPWHTKPLVKSKSKASLEPWKEHCSAASAHDPMILLALVARFPSAELRKLATAEVLRSPWLYCRIPEAVDLYLCDATLKAGAPHLHLFANCRIIQALRFLDVRFSSYPYVTSYAVRSLLARKSEHLIFYLPQLLQELGTDESGKIHDFLLSMSRKSDMFAHQLLWALRSHDQTNPKLAAKSIALTSAIYSSLSPSQEAFASAEFAFIDLLISVSGELKPVEKSKRKATLRARLQEAKFHEPIERHILYLPTDPSWRVTRLLPHTAGAMQSAAKCPILIQFACVEHSLNHNNINTINHTINNNNNNNINNTINHSDNNPVNGNPGKSSPTPETPETIKACIFKMGDDCRQDQLSLQLINLFQRVLNSLGVPSFLYPYRVVTTGIDTGVIECVPRAMSRDQIGKLVETNLAEYFVQTYGHPETVRFRRARECFIRSMASYSVASFILNIKDRHNGNLMIDADGHLVHIDFGFLFDYSPGGDMNFESSPFKLTAEMTLLMGYPVGTGLSPDLAKALEDKESYISYKTLTIRCYLAIRQYAREICMLVELMLRSALPCFKPYQTIHHLAQRLALDKTEEEAAQFMRQRIREARWNRRTVLYDWYQNIAEGIEM